MSKLELIRASCVLQNVDAIVNASNRYLLSGGGVCGAIFSEAGYKELNEACKKIKTPLNDGDAVITPAFNIKTTKYIIHAVGPNFSETPNAVDKLFNAYYNSLIVLKDNNLHSIAFPLISSGIYGMGIDNPVRVSTRECVSAYNKFINEYPDYNIEVKLCVFMPGDMVEAQKEIPEQ